MTEEKKKLTEKERLANIARAVQIIQGVIPEGILNYTEKDVVDECEQLPTCDYEENVDFDSDENEVDMENISPTMRALYE